MPPDEWADLQVRWEQYRAQEEQELEDLQRRREEVGERYRDEA
jgi:hypothetical protein